MAEYEDDRRSKFNAGVAMTERIDQLQRALNAARFNPLMQNYNTMSFNYEIMVSANDGLLKEAWPKLNDKEKILGEKIRILVKKFLELKPIMKKQDDGSLQINKDNYKKFLELVDYYERTNKTFLDSHSLNSPDYDDDDEGL